MQPIFGPRFVRLFRLGQKFWLCGLGCIEPLWIKMMQKDKQIGHLRTPPCNSSAPYMSNKCTPHRSE
ncbi:unnamed protein product [Dovyalis caffra]|uniref:Uncharacterized protein n=1 Tax=Dovyalis caffra TaxID=77055 RepID=A0AAV1S002_9ROSI|nr:unnamed protein product [Dovyalis caffra]